MRVVLLDGSRPTITELKSRERTIRREALGQRLDAEQTQSLIDRLVNSGWLREVTSPQGHQEDGRLGDGW